MKKVYLAVLLLATACAGNLVTYSEDDAVKGDTSSETGGGSSSGEGESSGGSESESGITETDGNIQIVYSPDGATVSGDALGIVKVSGNDVTVNNSSDKCFTYILSGTAADGFFKLYSEAKQVIELNSLTLTNPAGAAINNQSHKYTSVIVSGVNTVADGSVNSSGDYPDQTSDEDMKAAFFSEGQLVFSGSGSLKVTATGKAGITSDDYIRVTGTPVISVNSALGHGMRGKEKVVIEGGSIDVTVAGTGKKGISTDGDFHISGGSVTITSTASAGIVDDELTGAAGIKADSTFTAEGGSLVINVSGSGAKGIKCDGTGSFKGGSVKVTATGSNYGSSSSGGRPGGGPGGGGWGWDDSSSDDDSKSAKAIKFDGDISFSGAEVTATASAHEAIESKGKISISGGSVNATSSDDAINSASDMTVSGGEVYAFSSGNDGLDANGNMYVQGGYIYAVGSGSPEVALDANTEGGYKLYVSGGRLAAFGGIESGSSITQPVITVSSWTRNSTYSLYNGSTLLMEFTAPSSGGNGLVISHPDLQSGSKYTLKYGSSSTSVTASLSSQSGGRPGGR